MLTKDDLSQIKTVVIETIQPEIKALGMEIKTIKKTIATKDDLEGMATKDDLKTMATKDDLKGMATKDDLKGLETSLRGRFKTGLKGLRIELKSDIKALEKRLVGRIDEAQMEIITTVDKHKADKVKVVNLEKRVDRLEDNAGLPPFPTQ